MKPCFTFSEIKHTESQIINSENIPSIILMENAGKNSFDIIYNLFDDLKNYSVFVFCGKGNNAGDGLVIARNFIINNFSVNVIFTSSIENLSNDSKLNAEILFKNTSEKINYFFLNEQNFNDIFNLIKSNNGKILIIDALFGTGLNSGLKGFYKNIISEINSFRRYSKKIKIISLDVPSGLSESDLQGELIYADYTITMAAVKTELLYGIGKESSGKLFTVPIGITDTLLQKYSNSNKLFIESSDIKKLFPVRKKTSFKYSNGKTLIIGGSKTFSGAVIMSSAAALKSGAGAVFSAFPESVSAIICRKLREVIKIELPSVNNDTVSAEALKYLNDYLNKSDSVLIGPGLKVNQQTIDFVTDFIINCSKPFIIDADALNILALDTSILLKRKYNSPIILTPHLGEFSRIANVSIEELSHNRFEIAKSFALNFNVNIILKSETSFSCSSDGKIYINCSGNEQLASAGSGDILSGIIASILAQSKSPLTSMICGNYIHGKCAEFYMQKFGNAQSAMQKDLINFIPKVISHIIKS
jgi:NAD(P)H-hydrate epimerase